MDDSAVKNPINGNRTPEMSPSEDCAQYQQEYERDKKDYENDGPGNYVRLMAIISSINSCNLGYDQGVNAGVVNSFQRDGGEGLRLSDLQIEFFIGLLSLTALIGAMIMPIISDKFGRRMTLFTSQIVFIIGISVTVSSPNYAVLMLGRGITGIGIGTGLAIDAMYIAELAPAKYRGQLVSWSETADNFGILLGFIASYAFRNTPGDAQWRSTIGLGLIMPTVLIFLVYFVLAESPRWLIKQGRKEEAADIMQKSYCGTGSSSTGVDGKQLVAELENEMIEEEQASAGVSWRSLFANAVSRRKLLAGVGTAVIQQVTGEESILYYIISILAGAGITSVDEQFGALVMVGIAKVLSIIVAGYLFDNFGRKPLLMASNAGIAFALFLLAGVSNHVPAAGFAALIIYVVAFSGGMGPGAWLLPSEVFSNDIRAKGMSLCTFSNRAAALIVSSTFLSMRSAFTDVGIFAFYGSLALISIVYIFTFVPETRGKTLEEVHELFESKVGSTEQQLLPPFKANVSDSSEIVQ